MKKLFTTLMVLLPFVAIGQDTTIVQTFTYDSVGRSYDFNFPINPNTSYEKIIMQYSMRCKNALISNGSNPNLGCGEWDYSCNTYLVDSTQTDSAKATHPSHIISNFSGTIFDYTLNPTYTYYQYQQQQVTNNATISETSGTIGTGTLGNTHPFSTDQTLSKTQYLWTAAELSNAGITPGAITSVKLDVSTTGSDADYLRIRMKHSTATNLDASLPETDNFTEVYFLNTTLTAGVNAFDFYNPFVWDGTSNVIVEFSFTNPVSGTASTITSHDAGFDAALIAQGQNPYYTFSGVGSIDLDATNLSNITNEITIAFWQFGNEDVMPANSTIFEGTDAANRRQANVHLPWGNGQVYWDCGNDGSGYDRINLTANPADFEGQWNHWAFTKNATTGSMKIYLNGQLWHSGSNKTRPIDLTAFRIGASLTGGSVYHGDVDEFMIFNTELDQTAIADLMYQAQSPFSPYYAFLVAYYPLDEGIGNTTADQVSASTTATISGPTQWKHIRGAAISRNFSTSTERPNLTFVQGVYNQTITPVVTLDSVMNNQSSITAYTVNNNDLEEVNTTFVYPANIYVYTYDEQGNAIDSLFISSSNTINISTLNYYSKWPMALEIMSFVTPYGINLDLGPEGKMWEFDVTDYKTVLHGVRRIYLSRGGQNQEEMDIRFLFIEGTPPRDVHDIKQIWRVTSNSYTSIQAEDVFEPRDVMTSDSSSMFKIRTMITGHGQEGEFIPQTHYINAGGGPNEQSWQVWKECAINPIYPQGGTWIYDRAGWCPGEATDLVETDITDLVTPGQTINIDYGVNSGSGDSRYIVNHQLVSYGDPNFTLDAAIVDVIRPSRKAAHQRLNPTCGKPMVRIQNTGSTPLTSLVIAYGMKGWPAATYNWTGSLGFLETADVELDNFNWGWWSGEGEFVVNISAPNGGTDEYANNNRYTSHVDITPMHDSEFIIWMRTNNAPGETAYWLKDIDGNVIHSRNGGLSASTNYRDTLQLADGCYTLEIIDNDDDGISFWANSDGGGHFRIKGINQGYTTLNPDFGRFIEYDFTVGGTLQVEEDQFITTFEVYPNPSQGAVTIELDLFEAEHLQLEIVDMLGKTVHQETRNDFRSGSINVDLSHHHSGVYFCKVTTSKGTFTKRVVVRK